MKKDCSKENRLFFIRLKFMFSLKVSYSVIFVNDSLREDETFTLGLLRYYKCRNLKLIVSYVAKHFCES